MNEYYTTALDQAINWIEANFKAIGIVVSGSIIRGNPNANSDFDIFVIHEGNFRQRIQKAFNGVPCEIFVNNPARIYSYFDIELKANRPVSANMLLTGKVVKGDDHPVIRDLLNKAKEFADKSPARTALQNLATRYEIATLYEDATDLLRTDEITAAWFLDKAVMQCIDFAFLLNGKPLPRAKDRINQLQAILPQAGILVKKYYEAIDTTGKYEIAGQIVAILIGKKGFFEWSTEPE
jgi:hypothetical protein